MYAGYKTIMMQSSVTMMTATTRRIAKELVLSMQFNDQSGM
jgi:hypothetical protein